MIYYTGKRKQESSEDSSYTYNVDFVGNNIYIKPGTCKVLVNNLNARNSYLKTKSPIIDSIIKADTWKIALKYAEIGYSSRALNVFSAGSPGIDTYDFQVFQSGFENSALKLFISSDGNSWNIANGTYASSSLDPLSSDEMLMELEFTGTQYIWKMTNITKEDAEPTVCATINSNSKVGRHYPDGTPYYLILGNFQYNYPDYGNVIEYNLAESYYTIDGTTTYLAV